MNYQAEVSNSLAIRQEITRFESVHPNIYAIYDLLEQIDDPLLASRVRDHVVCIEDAFVNSQEWTVSRAVPELRLGVCGTLQSGKSALVHRYLTGSYLADECPEGGRFKKEVVADCQSHLLLIRDEGGPPEQQFSGWVDAVIFVFSLENEDSFNAVYQYYARIANYRNTAELPLILVGTQDAITPSNPRAIDDSRARKLANDLKRCTYYETCATYGLNVDRVFQDAAQKIVAFRYTHGPPPVPSSLSLPSTPNHTATRTNGHFAVPAPPITNGRHGNTIGAMTSTGTSTLPSPGSQKDGKDTSASASSTPTSTRKASRRRSNIFTPRKSADDDKKRQPNGDFGSGRAIPIKQGYLYKRSSKSLNKEWKKKYVTLCDDGRLTYHPSLHDYMEDIHGKEIRLLGTTVKVPGKRPPRATPQGAPATYHGTPSPSITNGITKDMHSMTISGSIGGTFSNDVALSRERNGISLVSFKGGEGNHTRSCSFTSSEQWDNAVIISNNSVTPVRRRKGMFGNGYACETAKENKDGGKMDPPPTPASGGGGKKRHRRMKSSGAGKSSDANNGDVPLLAPAGDASSGSSKFDSPPPPHKRRYWKLKSGGSFRNLYRFQMEDSDENEFYILSLDNKSWQFEAPNSEERDAWVQAIESQILSALQGNDSTKSKNRNNSYGDQQVIQAIRNIRGNAFCVDCEAPSPDWASLNLGALMCIECSGVHRNLGTHLSRVRSLDLDDWPTELATVMTSIGNSLANSVWEANPRGRVKPTPNSQREEKESWIRAKYERKEFLAPPPYPDVPISQQLLEGVTHDDIRTVVLLLAHANPSEVNMTLEGDGRTALHLACTIGNIVVTQLLLWYSADFNITDREGRAPLWYARQANNHDVAELLIHNGCQDDSMTTPSLQRRVPANNSAVFDKLPASVI
ncbi:arf-GAP with GTPase, ANK repeat and PH domain-containing protein 1-like isoform X6 [Branchiostoma floridae]|uniref:Arf-GAP with GTPase, ANK repeat and PH domain-containing protein 1-like isoform X6 n=1 Tax=Branchiostoma floridae TaxID=7739 RepID=A0A9J7HDV6_BRAFL|nr:arf-GAP with GTPase, ANK repeat and PH domain-containing protein 1-like isoform X6 [Branchiostoma floridae]